MPYSHTLAERILIQYSRGYGCLHCRFQWSGTEASAPRIIRNRAMQSFGESHKNMSKFSERIDRHRLLLSWRWNALQDQDLLQVFVAYAFLV